LVKSFKPKQQETQLEDPQQRTEEVKEGVLGVRGSEAPDVDELRSCE